MAHLVRCSEEEKEGISVEYVEHADSLIPLLSYPPAIELPELPETLAEEHCSSSDEDREVQDRFEMQLAEED